MAASRPRSNFILGELRDEIEHVRSPDFLRDFKSALQERLQADGRPLPVYEVTAERGPDHDKRFHVTVRVGGVVLADSEGRTKKEAEQVGGQARAGRAQSISMMPHALRSPVGAHPHQRGLSLRRAAPGRTGALRCATRSSDGGSGRQCSRTHSRSSGSVIV